MSICSTVGEPARSRVMMMMMMVCGWKPMVFGPSYCGVTSAPDPTVRAALVLGTQEAVPGGTVMVQAPPGRFMLTSTPSVVL
jgi:hypothetical protein